MIKIKVETGKIIIQGHAEYDDYGKDIVCAASSAIVETSVEAMARFDNSSVDTIIEKDKLTIIIHKSDDITTTLVENMLTCLKELSNQYPKNIQIINREE